MVIYSNFLTTGLLEIVLLINKFVWCTHADYEVGCC